MGGCDWIRYSGYAIKFLTIFSIFFSKWLIFHTNRILAPADNRFCALIRYLISEQFPYFYPFWHSILIWHNYKPAISLTHKKYCIADLAVFSTFYMEVPSKCFR